MKQLKELIPGLSKERSISEGSSGISYADLPAKMEELERFFGGGHGHCLGVDLANSVQGVLVILYLLLNDINFFLIPDQGAAGSGVPAFCDKVLRMKKDNLSTEEPNGIGEISDNVGFINEPGRVPAGSGSVIFSSSGTSGPAKYVCFSAADLLRNATNCIERFQLANRRKVLIPVPVNHMYGLGAGLLPALLAGADIFLINKSNVIKLVEGIGQFQPDLTFITPTLCKMVLAINKNFKSSGRFVSAGERLNTETILQFREKYGPLINLYGCTEMGVIGTSPEDGAPLKSDLADIIQPLQGVQVKIQGGGKEGEILVKHNAGFDHYMDKMGAAIPADPSYDGWYRTRDLGIDMGNAQYKIIGRIDYCINRNGFLIPLQEIEGRLSSILPELDQVIAVVGDGSTMSGATLIAIGELVKGQRLDGETARKACMSKMPRHLVPDEFYFIQKMPRLGNGKPDRSNLSKNYKLIIIQSANQDGGNHGEGNH